jgi:hypothetical protein
MNIITRIAAFLLCLLLFSACNVGVKVDNPSGPEEGRGLVTFSMRNLTSDTVDCYCNNETLPVASGNTCILGSEGGDNPNDFPVSFMILRHSHELLHVIFEVVRFPGADSTEETHIDITEPTPGVLSASIPPQDTTWIRLVTVE